MIKQAMINAILEKVAVKISKIPHISAGSPDGMRTAILTDLRNTMNKTPQAYKRQSVVGAMEGMAVPAEKVKFTPYSNTNISPISMARGWSNGSGAINTNFEYDELIRRGIKDPKSSTLDLALSKDKDGVLDSIESQFGAGMGKYQESINAEISRLSKDGLVTRGQSFVSGDPIGYGRGGSPADNFKPISPDQLIKDKILGIKNGLLTYEKNYDEFDKIRKAHPGLDLFSIGGFTGAGDDDVVRAVLKNVKANGGGSHEAGIRALLKDGLKSDSISVLRRAGMSDQDIFYMLKGVDDEHIVRRAMSEAAKRLAQSKAKDKIIAANPIVNTADKSREFIPYSWGKASQMAKSNGLATDNEEELSAILRMMPL